MYNKKVVAKVLSHFQKHSPEIAEILSKYNPESFPIKKEQNNYFQALINEIIAQQLSIKAAAAIEKRFYSLFPINTITPELVLNFDAQKLRKVGLSRQKSSYLKNLSEALVSKQLVLEELDKLSDEEVIKNLTLVKGIGRWTAEMFLLFTMSRPDIFSFGDLGLRNGFKKLYGIDATVDAMQAKTLIWKPYNSYASLALWSILDNKPVF